MELGARLIDAEQRLAELPELERKLAEADVEIERLSRDAGYLKATLEEVLDSPSWRLTAPLRSVRRMLRPGRRG